MSTAATDGNRSGFTLIEVVLALGVIAVAIPALLGLLGIFSDTSGDVLNRGEAASAVNSIQLFLEGEATDPATDDTHTFAAVYGWVSQARQSQNDPASAQLLYAYRTDSGENGYIVSASPPSGEIVGRLLAAEVLAPEESLLPDAVLGTDVAGYPKSYLPLRVSVYSLAAATQPRTRSELVGSYPLVISR